MEFYEMIKKWTKYDYFTPGIKAEVIIDMLLSEFIEEIVTSSVGEKVYLLAKEFPILTETDDLRNDKVDYLMGNDKGIYLVELKTTDASYDNNQFYRYYKYRGEQGTKLLDNFERIFSYIAGKKFDNIDKIIEDKFHESKAIDYIKTENIKTSRYKYYTTAEALHDGIKKIDANLSISDYFSNKNVEIVYITPKGVNDVDLKLAANIAICKNGFSDNITYIEDIEMSSLKKDNWMKVLEILKEIY